MKKEMKNIIKNKMKNDRLKLKAIVMSNVTNFILLVVGIVLIVWVIFTIFPSVSKGIESIANNIKKPFCCDMLKCKPAATQATTDIAGGIVCSSFCWGICDTK
jgi:hypothetical protein